jgi:L-iditol 2-dehydrogenase
LLLAEPPAPFGHEFCGIDVATGDRVVAANSAPCGECSSCHRGQVTQCCKLELLNGAYAELIVVPERIVRVNLHRVPPGVAPEVAAMVEPLACCLHGVEHVKAGDTVAILGAGPIGLVLAACVADAGASPVIVGGRQERRALAPEFGARVGDGDGADVVIEAAGTADAWREAQRLVRRGGTVVFFGGLPAGDEVALDAYRVHYEELTLRGAFHHTPQTVRAALAFLGSGARPWEKLVTHRVGLDGVAALFRDPPRDLLKAAVVP